MTAQQPQPTPAPSYYVERCGGLTVYQPVRPKPKENPVSECTACEHPVIIPEHMRDTVTEIHTCEGEAA